MGPEFCRDETFLETSQKFTSTLLPSAVWTNFMTFGPLRPLLSKLTTWFHKTQLEASIKLLTPEIKRRMRAREAEKPSPCSDSIEWLIDIAEKMDDQRELSVRRLAENVLHLLFAANSAPGALVTQMVYEVLMDPRYLGPLRDEIAAALRAEGSWTAEALADMPLLDSFVRETLRMYPPGSSTSTEPIGRIETNPSFFFPPLTSRMHADGHGRAVHAA